MEINKKFTAIIQARLGSSRLKGKILMKIKNKTFLEILITRLKKSKKINKIVIATTKKKHDDRIIKFCKKQKIDYFRGPENNVLKRYYLTAKKFNAQNIVRITSDCPLADPGLIDFMISKYQKKRNIHYLSNTNPPSYPNGFCTEVFSYKVLKYFSHKKLTSYEKEHVTPKIKKSNFKKMNIKYKKNIHNIRLTIDYKKDINFFKKFFKFIKYDYNISLNKILYLIEKKSNLFIKD